MITNHTWNKTRSATRAISFIKVVTLAIKVGIANSVSKGNNTHTWSSAVKYLSTGASIAIVSIITEFEAVESMGVSWESLRCYLGLQIPLDRDWWAWMGRMQTPLQSVVMSWQVVTWRLPDCCPEGQGTQSPKSKENWEQLKLTSPVTCHKMSWQCYHYRIGSHRLFLQIRNFHCNRQWNQRRKGCIQNSHLIDSY